MAATGSNRRDPPDWLVGNQPERGRPKQVGCPIVDRAPKNRGKRKRRRQRKRRRRARLEVRVTLRRSGRASTRRRDHGVGLLGLQVNQLGDQLESAADRYAKLHQEAVPELAFARAGALSEPIRDRAARSGLHLWDGPVDPG
jgi:hypothetical protein